MSLSRPTAIRFPRVLGPAIAVLAGAGLLASAAGAAPTPATCPGQAFSQPFLSVNDSNFYTLLPGSQFTAGSEGWSLSGGASVVTGSRPDGTLGNTLDLPAGATAVSPPICVTLQYPTARAYAQAVTGGGSVPVHVEYLNVKNPPGGFAAGNLPGKTVGRWELPSPFNVAPFLAGKEEGAREVRFILTGGARGSDYHVWGVWVDPRLSH